MYFSAISIHQVQFVGTKAKKLMLGGANSSKPGEGRQELCQTNCWSKSTAKERYEWIKSFPCGEGHDVGRRE